MAQAVTSSPFTQIQPTHLSVFHKILNFSIPAQTEFLHWLISDKQILVLTYCSYCVLHQPCGRSRWTPPLWRHARWRRTWDHGQVRHCNALLPNRFYYAIDVCITMLLATLSFNFSSHKARLFQFDLKKMCTCAYLCFSVLMRKLFWRVFVSC